jgi:membrane protein
MSNVIAAVADLARPRAEVLWRVWRRIQQSRTSLIAAGCAFYATLALFPGISALLSLYGLAFKPQTVMAQVDVLKDLLPPEGFQLIAKRVQVLVAHSPRRLQWSVWIGTAGALWSASTGAKAVLAGIDHMHSETRRPFLRFQAVGMAMTLAAMVAALLALAIMLALPGALGFVGFSRRARGLLHGLSFAVLVLFVAAAIAALYRFGPTPEPGRKWPILPGTLVATTLWLAASEGFSAYVARLADFDFTYGPLATLAGVMLWFWVSSFVVLLGAAVNVEMQPGE